MPEQSLVPLNTVDLEEWSLTVMGLDMIGLCILQRPLVVLGLSLGYLAKLAALEVRCPAG